MERQTAQEETIVKIEGKISQLTHVLIFRARKGGTDRGVEGAMTD
jgi:hypothetical protein